METLKAEDFSAPFDPLGDSGRRIFIKGLGFVGASLLLGTLGACDQLAEAIKNRPVRRRLRSGSPEVDADIATYRQAVTAMMAKQGSDPLSWSAQAAIHGVPAHFNYCQHGTDHFFDWHRAYLAFFERICRKLTGNAQFGLPYWNWNQDPAIHAAFLDSTSPLYLARSRTSMAGSWNDTTAALDPIFSDSNFFTFQTQIEGTPHNHTHSYVGGTFGGYASASDPLFWMHHCMVDYCWAKWNIELGNDNTNDSTWNNTSNEHFVDENSAPASMSGAITTILPLLSYRYESSAIGSSPATGTITSNAEFKKLEARIRAGADVRFAISQRVRLSERAATSISKPLDVATKLSAADFGRIIGKPSAAERVFASIEYAQLPAESDFSVRVFVNLPEANRRTANEDPHFAGSFAFFGTAAAGEAEPSGHKHAPRFLVDLTTTLARLRKMDKLREDDPLSLRLVPTPFGDGFEHEDTELVLSALDVIVTPVRVATAKPRG